jgi:hypothetical protein
MFVRKSIDVSVPREVRLVPWINWTYVRALINLIKFLGTVPFYRSSISFAIFLGKALGYRSIRLYNFDPYNKTSKHDSPHPTSVIRDSLNVYEYLNQLKDQGLLLFEKDETCLF